MIEFGMLNGSTGKHFASYCLKPFGGQAKGPTIGFLSPLTPAVRGGFGSAVVYSFHLADPGVAPQRVAHRDIAPGSAD